MIAPDQTIAEFSLPPLDVRALARRAAVPALLAATALAVMVLAGGRISAVAEAVRRLVDVSPAWALTGVAFEGLSLAGYVALLSLVTRRATPRIGVRESAQITLAGAAATRLLPTAGAGGAALTVWALRRAGLHPRTAARTLLVFLVLMYSVFLVSIAAAGAALTLAAGSHGPKALAAIAAAVAVLAIALALAFAVHRTDDTIAPAGRLSRHRARLRAGSRFIGAAVRDALQVARSGDVRLAGAVAYWMFDAAVLWAMLHAFGASPSIQTVALAYLIGQVANTVPLPGTVSGGMAGVLIAFGSPAVVAIPAVLAYRTVAVWLPLPPAIAAVPKLRATVAQWAHADAARPVTDSSRA
jgi:uncharacterized membrane protein YbhN (UPF0104 family)